MSFGGHRNVSKHDGSNPSSWYQFRCGHCDTSVSGAVAASYGNAVKWLLCPNCEGGSVANLDRVDPGAPFGPRIEGLPADTGAAYEEARQSMAVHAYTGAELICRKILMHVAVEKKAEEGKSFASYVDHLAAEGYVTPPMKPWVDVIRQHGNQAAHELDPPDKDRAESTVMFTAELLRLVYEMAHMAQKYGGKKPNP